MIDFFNDSGVDRSNCHTKFSDIAPETVNEWRATVQKSGVDPGLERLKLVNSEHSLHKGLEDLYRDLLITTEYMTRETSSYIVRPHLFVLTNHHGMILNLFGEKVMVESLKKINFKAGTSLALEDAGINGISVAMQMNKTVVVQGDEHDLHLLTQFTCICAPIRHNGNIVGYLDLSLHAEEEVTFAVPILKQIIRKIEESLAMEISEVKKTYLYSILKKFKLSPREKEVASLLLNNTPREQIAKQLFLSIDTVHTHVRNIYLKTKVKDKPEFIRQFLFLLK